MSHGCPWGDSGEEAEQEDGGDRETTAAAASTKEGEHAESAVQENNGDCFNTLLLINLKLFQFKIIASFCKIFCVHKQY